MTHQHSGLEEAVHVSSSWPGDLSGRVASRICHDLVSPLGAIGNGLELLEMTGGGAAEAALVADSARTATARLRLYRLAFGAAQADRSIDAREAGAALADPERGARAEIDWTAAGLVPRPEAQLAVLLALCAESGLPQGGRVAISGPAPWRIEGSGTVLVDGPPWEALGGEGDPDGRSPGQVHFELAHHCAARLGLRIDCQIDPSRIRLSVA